jgi:heme-degrading monooxygenase HmoA
MIAVIFEVELKSAEAKARYLDIAASLRQELQEIDGFISIERYASLGNEHRMLSLSYWRDEDAILTWRRHPQHEAAQLVGNRQLFEDWRILIAPVLRTRNAAMTRSGQ